MKDIRELILIGASALFVALTPIHGLILVISLLVASDTIYAIYATVKLKGWEAFRSHKLYNIVPKTFGYMGGIILAFMIDKFFFEGELKDVPFAVSKVITAIWCYIELKSIDETRIKLGHQSFMTLMAKAFVKIKEFKKNIQDL